MVAPSLLSIVSGAALFGHMGRRVNRQLCANPRYDQVPGCSATACTGPSALASGCPPPAFRDERVARAADFRGAAGLVEGRDSHQVQLVMNIGRGGQVAHRGLQGLVAHPVLHGTYIEPLRSIPVAYVERNVFRSNFVGSSLARVAMDFSDRACAVRGFR